MIAMHPQIHGFCLDCSLGQVLEQQELLQTLHYFLKRKRLHASHYKSHYNSNLKSNFNSNFNCILNKVIQQQLCCCKSAWSFLPRLGGVDFYQPTLQKGFFVLFIENKLAAVFQKRALANWCKKYSIFIPHKMLSSWCMWQILGGVIASVVGCSSYVMVQSKRIQQNGLVWNVNKMPTKFCNILCLLVISQRIV